MRIINLVIGSTTLIFFVIVMLVQSFNPPIYWMFGLLTALFGGMGIESLKDGQKWVGSVFLFTAFVSCLTIVRNAIIA